MKNKKIAVLFMLTACSIAQASRIITFYNNTDKFVKVNLGASKKSDSYHILLYPRGSEHAIRVLTNEQGVPTWVSAYSYSQQGTLKRDEKIIAENIRDVGTDTCTITVEENAVKLGLRCGSKTGPEYPWDKKPRETYSFTNGDDW